MGTEATAPSGQSLPQEDANLSEFYKARAKEFRERYEGMRTLEWQTLLQTYAGYAAIAVAFPKAADWFNNCHWAWLFRFGAMLVTLVFFGAMHYFYYRIDERLILFDDAYHFFLNKTRGSKPADTPPGLSDLGNRYFWTYNTQFAVSLMAVFALLAFEGNPKTPVACNNRWELDLILAMSLLALEILMWGRGRRRLGRLKREAEARQEKYNNESRSPAQA
jgi:hypothetical protein